MSALGTAQLLVALTQAASLPPPPTAPRPAAISCTSIRTPDGAAIIVDNIAHVYFRSGSARIDARGAAMLDVFLAHHGTPAYCRVSVDGHADMAGPAAANRALSRRRAEAVAAYLSARGLAAQVRVEFFGEARPMVETEDGVAEPQNRRVEVYVQNPRRP